MISFLELTKRLNDKAISLQNRNENEYITYNDALKAITIANKMHIENEYDALLYILSLNLLNTYVKQKDSKIGYSFKADLIPFVKIMNQLQIKNISMFMNKEHGNTVLYITMGAIQFSFHGINKELVVPNEYLKEQQFDYVRKHLCALTLFNDYQNYIANN